MKNQLQQQEEAQANQFDEEVNYNNLPTEDENQDYLEEKVKDEKKDPEKLSKF